MSGTSLDSDRRLGPSEQPSIERTDIDLSDASLYPVANRVSQGVRNQGDDAWRMDRAPAPEPRVDIRESTTTSLAGRIREKNIEKSDFQTISQVGQREHDRTLGAMISEGASLEQAYRAAQEIRYRVTSEGGTFVDQERESLQPQPLTEVESDSLQVGEPAVVVDRTLLDENVAGIEQDGLGVSTGAEREGLRERFGRDSDNPLALNIEAQFGVVEALKEGRVEELTALAGIERDRERGLTEEIDPELERHIEEQFNAIRDLMNQRQAALSAIQSEQQALGAKEEEALTF